MKSDSTCWRDNAAGFKLQSGYFEIFKPSTVNETILWTDASIGNCIWNGLHYNQQTPDNTGGWLERLFYDGRVLLFGWRIRKQRTRKMARKKEEVSSRLTTLRQNMVWDTVFGLVNNMGANGQPFRGSSSQPFSLHEGFPWIGGK